MILAISVLSYVQSNMATNGQHFLKGTFWYILDMLFRRIQTYYCKKKKTDYYFVQVKPLIDWTTTICYQSCENDRVKVP